MRKVWEVLLDLIYEDAFQFLGPIVGLALVWLLARVTHTPWLGLLLFAIVGLSLFLSLRREQRQG